MNKRPVETGVDGLTHIFPTAEDIAGLSGQAKGRQIEECLGPLGVIASRSRSILALPNHSPKELLALSESWRPWRSYATMNLWNSL